MIAIILLFLDFILLGGVCFFYFRRASRERAQLLSKAGQSLELQQKVYQIQVLQEIGERIGYSLDSSKIIEIITNSIGNLLQYETVSFMLYDDPENIIFKCHVHQAVNHRFIDEVKEKMHAATTAMCNRNVDMQKIDERMGGALLDDNLNVSLMSYINIPIIINDRLLGLINISSTKPGQFSHDEAAVLYTITNQAAVAVSQLQHVLENEREKLAGIIQAMTDGVFMVDLHNQLLVYNPAVIDLLRMPVGREPSTFDIVDSLAGKVDLRTKIDEALAKDIPISIKEVVLQDRVLDITVTPVRDHAGQHRGVAVILHDVTSEKSLEKLRQEFTAMMVHELRAPLTAVRWSSEALIKSLSDSKAQSDLSKLKDTVHSIDLSAVNMLELVNDLLDVAKIEAGKFDLNEQDYDLVEIAKTELQTFQPEAEGKHLVLNLTAPSNLKVKCDRVRISQVMNNLLSNAIKYTDSGSIEINISHDNRTNRAVVAIKDSGMGVSHEDLAVLFSKFRQLKSSARKGTGLGLVVSKGIIEAHGGQIWAESAGENFGSTFSFSLPL